MLISHKYKFIFIAVPKTGCQSLGVVKDSPLRKCLGRNDIIIKDKKNKGHVTVKELQEKYPEEFKNYFKFCFVRNPWDRIVSGYFYMTKMSSRISKLSPLKPFSNFKEFVHKNDIIVMKKHIIFRPQYKQLVGGDNILVDFVGRFENLDKDFKIVCNKINLPSSELLWTNKSGHSPYREEYDEETKQLVQELYQKDIELFGYNF